MNLHQLQHHWKTKWQDDESLSWDNILRLFQQGDGHSQQAIELLVALDREESVCLLFEEEEAKLVGNKDVWKADTPCTNLFCWVLDTLCALPPDTPLRKWLAEGRFDDWAFAHLSQTPSAKIPETARKWCCSRLMEMVDVPAGTFRIGNELSGDNVDTEIVILTQFQVGVFPVTNLLAHCLLAAEEFEHFGQADASVPATHLSWWQVLELCNALSLQEGRTPVYSLPSLSSSEIGIGQFFSTPVAWNTQADGYRLLTEAEWEVAARAGQSLRYSGSDRVNDVCRFVSDPYLRSTFFDAPYGVRQYKANAWGLYDLTGNVREWCFDAFRRYDACGGHPIGYGSEYRSVRGGSIAEESKKGLAIRHRGRFYRFDKSFADVGFRLARGPILNTAIGRRSEGSLLSTTYLGHYEQFGQHHPQEVQIIEQGEKLIGWGHDALSPFELLGQLNGAQFSFEKKYCNLQQEAVVYSGTIQRHRWQGQWSLHSAQGSFSFAPVSTAMSK